MRREPAGIDATDFKGKGEPWENGRTESWNVPRLALPVQPGGAAAADQANNTAIRIRITTFYDAPGAAKVDRARRSPTFCE